MPKRKGRHAKDIRIATQRARVKYGPERSTLRQLLGEAKAGLRSDLAGAESSAASAIHFARRAEKPVAAIYDASRGIAEGARQDVEAAFGKLGAAADPYRAVTAREREGAAGRLAAERATALRDLQDRQLEAVAGRQYARTQAKGEYLQNTAKLRGQQADLNRRMGDYIAQEAASIADARAGRKATTRGIRLRGAQAEELEGIKQRNRVALEGVKQANRDKASGGLPKGVKPATRAELRGFKGNFTKALSYANQFRDQGDSRHKAAVDLTRGVSPTSTSPVAVPSIGDQLALSIGLDMAYDGHVSRANARALRAQGIRVRDLPGAVSYTKYEKRRRNQQLASSVTP